MPVPAIIKGEEHFFVTTYEGNGGGQRVGKFVPFTDNGTIAKSCIFERGDSPRLNRTPSGTGTSRRKYTLSVWAKPSVSSSASDERYIITAGPYGNDDGLTFDDDRTLKFWLNGRTSGDFKTNRTFEDSSKFFHILVAVDTTQSTASDRVKIYVDGDQQTSFSLETYPSQDYDCHWGNAVAINVGSSNNPNRYYNGYLAEVNYVDGTALTPATFGLTDTSTGRWIPKSLSSITYGTNGFRLEFANSAGQTIGDDTSGNTNDLTVTNLAAADITTDSPTQNHNTVDPHVNPGSDTISQGNLKTVGGSSTYTYTVGNMKLKKGKYYAEFKITAGGGNATQIGIAGRHSTGSTNHLGYNPTTYSYYGNGGGVYLGLSTNSATSWGAGYTDNDYVGVALDLDNNKIYYAKNNTWQNSSDPETGANAIEIIPPEQTQFGGYAFAVGNFEGAGGPTVEHNYGQRSFQYTPPDGYVAVQQDNFSETGKGIPDFVWIKNRDASDAHAFYDSSRGPQKEWENSESNEATVTDGLQKFLKGGFATEDNVALNTSGESFVAWNWVGNNGTEVANADGSGATVATTIQANDTAGFSICRFQGTGSTLKFAHGLSATPEWFITKRLDAGAGAATSVYHTFNGINKYLHFNEPDAMVSSGAATSQFTGVSSTNITLGSNSNSNNNGSNVVAYVWRSVEGFSKFGSYVGSANANGPLIYTGFKPAWIMIKRNDGSAQWFMFDNKRNLFNPVDKNLRANQTNADSTTTAIDFLSNGFKIRHNASVISINENGARFVYMAFAEHPFIGSGTNPATAR